MPGLESPHHLPDRIEVALEASCVALRALECSRAELAAAPDLQTARADTTQAIGLLRHAIGELRSASSSSAVAVAQGFVLARRTHPCSCPR
jgi:hypothetical protein